MSKNLYKLELFVIKVIPAVIAFISFLNTVLYYFGINAVILTYIGGISFLTIGFLYLTSYVFQFCEYHRMSLHYIVVVNLISYIDMDYGIQVSDFDLLILYTSLYMIFTLTALIMRNEIKIKELSCKTT